MSEILTAICIECGTEFLKNSSKMEELCPKCANLLYGYPFEELLES